MKEPEERAAVCVVTALEGQNIPWVLQQRLIHNVAEEIRAAIADELQLMADALEVGEASEQSLAELKAMVKGKQAGQAFSRKQHGSKEAA